MPAEHGRAAPPRAAPSPLDDARRPGGPAEPQVEQRGGRQREPVVRPQQRPSPPRQPDAGGDGNRRQRDEGDQAEHVDERSGQRGRVNAVDEADPEDRVADQHEQGATQGEC